MGIRYGELLIMASLPITKRYQPGSKAYLTLDDEDLNLFDTETGVRLARPGMQPSPT